MWDWYIQGERYSSNSLVTCMIVVFDIWNWIDTCTLNLMKLWSSNYSRISTGWNVQPKVIIFYVGGFKYILFCPKLYDQITIFDQNYIICFKWVGFFNHLPSILVPREGSICLNDTRICFIPSGGPSCYTQPPWIVATYAACIVWTCRVAVWSALGLENICYVFNLVGLFEMKIMKLNLTPNSEHLSRKIETLKV